MPTALVITCSAMLFRDWWRIETPYGHVELELDDAGGALSDERELDETKNVLDVLTYGIENRDPKITRAIVEVFAQAHPEQFPPGLALSSLAVRNIDPLRPAMIRYLEQQVTVGRIRLYEDDVVLAKIDVLEPLKYVPQPVVPEKTTPGWIELRVEWDSTGEPVQGMPLVLEISGSELKRETNSDGRIRLEGVEGVCLVRSSYEGLVINRCLSFVGTGPAAVMPKKDSRVENGATPLAIASIEEHKVRTGETLESIAAEAGIDWRQLAKFNWGTQSPQVINERLHDVVGCTKKTADDRNYLFNDSDCPGIVYIPREWNQSFEPRQTHHIRVRRAKGVLLVLENEEGLRLPEVDYRVTYDDGRIQLGRLGRNGMALVPCPPTGSFEVIYPDEVDVLAKSLAASVRKGMDQRRTHQIFRLFAQDRSVVSRAIAAYDNYFNDHTGGGILEDLYEELSDPDAIAICENLMALHGIHTRSSIQLNSMNGDV